MTPNIDCYRVGASIQPFLHIKAYTLNLKPQTLPTPRILNLTLRSRPQAASQERVSGCGLPGQGLVCRV